MGIPSPIEVVLTLGKYSLLEKIGEGYLGSVYRGFDQGLDRAVAVRVLCDGIKWDPKVEELFNQQCRAIATLDHPGIASIFDAGKDGQSHFIVMESLGGTSLQSLIAQKPVMTVETKVSIMIQVAEGLGHAHKNGILHRDLAPAKIHLTLDRAAKIRDFAVAHVLRKHLPHPAIRWGAPIYLSPEQVQQQDCDPRSDIFSAGTLFYELLTYHHPFYDRDGNKALDNILLSIQIPTFDMFPDEPPGIWPILKTCLEKNPKDRYQNMDEFSSACKDLLKDLAEDTQLMLAELYAALSPLKKAAAQPGASENTVLLLQDIQKLLSGEKQADYASLDRLMTVLLEQYPVIRAAAGALSTTDPADMQLPPEEVRAAFADETSQVPLCAPVAAQDLPLAEPALTAAGAQSNPAPFMPHDLQPVGRPSNEADPNNSEFFEPSYAEVWDFSPVSEYSPPPPIPDENGIITPAAESKSEAMPPAAAPVQSIGPRAETPDIPKVAAKPRRRRISRLSYRAVAGLALLVIAAAVCIAWGSQITASMNSIWKLPILHSHPIAKAVAFLRGNSDHSTVSVVSANGSKQSASSPKNQSAFAGTDESAQLLMEEDPGSIIIQPPQETVTRISALINSGKLQTAKAEIDQLQRSYPGSSRMSALRRQWKAKDAAAIQEQTFKDQEQQLNATRRQKEDEWNRQVATLFANGKYNEAEGVLSVWLAENPGNWNAQQFGTKLGEIQHNLKTYTAAMAENRYQDALNAVGTAERTNPADSNLAELRRQAEARKANAKASLTVHRLGPKGALFLDGRPISNNGEINNESIPIGSHLLAIENGGSPVVSLRQEFLEGQRIALVYDLDRQYLRAMAESDRELLAQRKAMEEVRFFDAEHVHGTFRGICRGTLAVDYLDIAFKPSSGFHGFRMPFKQLKLSVNSRSVNLLNSSDGTLFQSFKLHDEQAAAKFKQSWDELKTFARQVAENK
jgi:serine/threonine protein kinase